MTKTDIIPDGLRLNFERHFCQSEKIILSKRAFQQLLDEIEQQPTSETQKRRKEIRKYIMW